ncbi:MAG: hypothetical protein WBZ29_17050 [Methanocella sp.]
MSKSVVTPTKTFRIAETDTRRMINGVSGCKNTRTNSFLAT